MREIKFRVWANGTMLKSDEYKDLPFYINVLDGKIYQGTTEKGDFSLIERSDFVPIQYTGLKDISYEGDILEFAVPTPSGYENYDGEWVDTTPDVQVGVAVFKNGCFYLKCEDELMPFSTPKSGSDDTPFIELFCVIGNIYENKELLKAKK